MKRIHALIILISMVVTIIILIGYVVGNIRHKMDDGVSDEISSVLSEDNIPLNADQILFALQLLASNNFNKVDRLKGKLRNQGQKSKITKLKRNGEIIYRLRAEELLPEDEAIALGEQLKSTFSEIDGYWLEEQAIYIQAIKPQTEFDQFEKQETNTNNAQLDKQIPGEKPKTAEKIVASTKPKPEPTVKTEEISRNEVTTKSSDSSMFEIQLLASSNYKAMLNHQKNLNKAGYPAKILKVVINGKTIYRLRLQKRYTQADATAIGRKLIKETSFKDFWLQDLEGNEVYPDSQPKAKPTFTGDYDIQILANTSKNFVEKKLAALNKTKYDGKIVTAVVKGKTYYRLRLKDSYDYTNAQKIAKQLKSDVKFISNCWVVKADFQVPTNTGQKQNSVASKPKAVKNSPKQEPERTVIPESEHKTPDNMLTSLNPKYAPRKILYTITCPKNNVDIRIGPGLYYDLDEIGKLMKGVKLYVVEDRNGWLRFRLMKDSYDWAGWVRAKDLK